MQIQRDITNVNCASRNKPLYIIIHDTGNTDKGANALRHALLFKNPNAKVSYHITIDDYRAIQSVEFHNRAYHSGKKYGQASVPEANNSNSIGISMCVNSDCNKQKAYENLIDVTKQVMKQFNIPIGSVIRHYDACKKHCPEWIMDNKLWDNFKKRLVSNVVEDDDMIADTVKVAACKQNTIANAMVDEIKILEKVVGLKEDGIATEELVKKLPELNGAEQRGCVTVMQRILIRKGFLSAGSATGIIGPSCINAIRRFKIENGIPLDTKLIDRQTWRKLLEY